MILSMATNAATSPQNSEDSTSEAVDKIKAEIQRVQAERVQAKHDHGRTMHEMNDRICKLTAKLKKDREAIQRNITVHKYAAVLRDDKTPNAILILQAKLCRQIHIVCVEKSQLKLIMLITKRLSSHGQNQIAQIIQERNVLEMEILNKMATLQYKEKEFQDSCQNRIRTQSLEIVNLHKELSDRSLPTESDPTLDGLLDRISDLNTKLQNQKNGKLNDPTNLPPRQGSFRKEKPLSRYEMRMRAIHQRASDSSPKISMSLSGLSASIRNIVTADLT